MDKHQMLLKVVLTRQQIAQLRLALSHVRDYANGDRVMINELLNAIDNNLTLIT